MYNETLKYILSRVIVNAWESRESYKQDKSNLFQSGRHLAYYEVLDTIKNQLLIEEEDLKQFGLDIDLNKDFL